MTSHSQQFSKEILNEEFFVLHENEEPDDEQLLEYVATESATNKISIVEPEKYKKKEEPADDGFQLTEDHEEEAVIEKEAPQDAENLDTDFFERTEDGDNEKTQVIEKISGMTETAEVEPGGTTGTTEKVPKEKHEVSEAKSVGEVAEGREDDDVHRRQTIQFKSQETELEQEADVTSVKSDDESEKIENARESLQEKLSRKKSTETDMAKTSASRTKRISGAIPDTLMKMSKKSLLALTGSTDGTIRRSVFGTDTSTFQESSFSQSKRGTFYTELGPRYRQVEDEDILDDFDFGHDAPIFFDVLPEEEEVISVHEEEDAVKLDREPFYERHDKAAQEVAIRKMKNCLLHKKLAMYFKRKKMDYATKETEWSFDSQNKYVRKLGAYGELADFINYERVRVTQELDDAKKLRADKFTKLTNMFKKMQDREGEIGYGLINTKTGNAIPDKFVERLLRRQNTQMTQVSSMRLTFIRLKGMVQEKLDAIASLNEIAPGFLLGDYEQLKSDNRAYSDKIEEKDEELTRLRSKCVNTIQLLAHLREKTSALDSDLDDLVDERQTLEFGYFVVRSQLNEQKQSRDNVRHGLNKMRDESGLLTQPTLLKDMEHGLEDVKELTDQLTQITKEYKKRAEQIKCIRRKMEEFIDVKRGISKKSLTHIHSTMLRTSLKKDKEKSSSACRVYKGRPSLVIPIIEDSAFHSLKSIKPQLTYDRCHRSRHVHHNKRTGG